MTRAEQERMDGLQALAATTLEIAAAAPERQGTYSYGARIPWSLIDRAREQLEAGNVDWRKFKREHDARQAARDRELDARRAAENA